MHACMGSSEEPIANDRWIQAGTHIKHVQLFFFFFAGKTCTVIRRYALHGSILFAWRWHPFTSPCQLVRMCVRVCVQASIGADLCATVSISCWRLQVTAYPCVMRKEIVACATNTYAFCTRTYRVQTDTYVQFIEYSLHISM